MQDAGRPGLTYAVLTRVCVLLGRRLDIALDLPPPAAVQRRTLPPQPAFDMGPLLPPMHNPKEADAQLQRDFMATPGKEQRPPTQVRTTTAPLWLTSNMPPVGATDRERP